MKKKKELERGSWIRPSANDVNEDLSETVNVLLFYRNDLIFSDS